MKTILLMVYPFQDKEKENEPGPSNSHLDRAPPRGQGGKGASRQAKQRAIARGDNLAPAQVGNDL